MLSASKQSQNSTDQTPAVNVVGISKSFASHIVLQDISFQLTRGQSFCICGPNAAGKTTLLRIIAGLLQPSEGFIRIGGFDARTHAQRTKAMLGAIFHKTMVYPQLTVTENLRFFARLYGVKSCEARIQELLDRTGLAPYRHDSAGVLSRGMAQRLAIARALVHKPLVLLADEPFTGLDTNASKVLVTLLNNFKDQGGTVVMTTHNVNLSLQCSQGVAVLDDRRLIFEANVSEINTADFEKDYLSYARANT